MSQFPHIEVAFKDSVLVEELGEEAVLLDTKSEHYYGLDDIALRYWQLLQTHGNTTAVVSAMQTEYDVAEAVLHQDLGKLLVELEKVGLIDILPTV